MFKLKRFLLKTFGWKSHFFRKSFLIISLIAFIPGLIIGLGIHFIGVGQVEEELKALHEQQINERALNISDQFDYLEVSLSHWAFEPRFNTSLINYDFEYEFQETRDIVRTLLVLEGSHPLIDQVELFIDAAKPVLFKPKYNVLDAEEAEKYRSVMTNHLSIAWNQHAALQGDVSIDNPAPLVLTHSVPGVSRRPVGTIIVKLDHAKVVQLLKTLTPYREGATLLLAPDYRVLAFDNNTGEANFTVHLRERVLEEIQKKEEGSFAYTSGGETYTVSYGTMRRIDADWTYVSASPVSSITSPIVFVSRVILVFSLTGLIAALIMSWLGSRKIYSPVARLVQVLDRKERWAVGQQKDEFKFIEQAVRELTDESQTFQQRLSTQLPQLRNSFLLQLIQGYLYHYTENELRERMRQYSWRLDGHYFVVMDVQVFGLYKAEAAFLNNDESLVSFAVANMLAELAAEHFEQYDVLNSYDLSASLLLAIPEEQLTDEKLHAFSEKLISVFNRLLRMDVTVTISNPDDKVKRIPHLVEEVARGKRYRNFKDRNQIIHLRHMDTKAQPDQVYYPFEIEKEILQSIRMGHVEEAERLVREFIQQLTDKGATVLDIQPGFVQLYGSVHHEILRSGMNPFHLFEGRNMYEELSQIREPEQLMNWLTEEVIKPYVNVMEGKVNLEMKQLVEKVCQHIEHHYMDDISLESCADDVGTNPYTLSKAFKRTIGVNFIDYLTKVRIDKAKELLLNTSMKMYDIASSVGYRHSYFNRIFKKQVGLTPMEYRRSRSRVTRT